MKESVLLILLVFALSAFSYFLTEKERGRGLASERPQNISMKNAPTAKQ